MIADNTLKFQCSRGSWAR